MGLAIGCTTSGAEELQLKDRGAKAVKALNSVFAEHQDKGRIDEQVLTAFVAGDDEEAQNTVLSLARDTASMPSLPEGCGIRGGWRLSVI